MKTHIVLIDFENVQPKDLASLRGTPFQIRVFCGANQSKIPFAFADQLQALGPNAQYVRIQGTGPNALDFHIAYYIGLLSAQSPDAIFYIISKDKGFEPLIKHLATQNTICHLLPSLTSLSVCAPAKPTPPTRPAPPAKPAAAPSPTPAAKLPPAANPAPTDKVQKVADALLTRKEARPRKLKTLTAFIRAQMNNHATDSSVTEVISRLTRAGMATGAEGKLTWPST